MKTIVEAITPVLLGAIFLVWFGFNEYFKKNGLTFRQGVHHLFHPHDTHHPA